MEPFYKAIFQGVIILAAGFLIFYFLEAFFYFRKQVKPLRSYWLDIQYWFASALYDPIAHLIISVIFSMMALDVPKAANPIKAPLALQLFGFLLVRDVFIYARHRLFHARATWPYHSVHHSSEEVNWTSTVRFHPIELMIESMLSALIFIVAGILGADAKVLSIAGLLIAFYNLFIHSNLRFTYGPLRYVFVSPVFHRWHHSDNPEAFDKNFAALFSFLDLLLGTFYMPKNKFPETTGLAEESKNKQPKSFIGQTLYPFR